ncbi:MAG: NINE protein [Caldimonas sp.]
MDGVVSAARVDRGFVAPSEDRRLKGLGLVLIGAAGVLTASLSNAIAGLWPLPADRFVEVAAAALLAVNLLAFGLLVLAAGCGSARTWRNPARRRAIALQIALANVLAPALLYLMIASDPGVEAKIEAQGWDVAAAVVGYALFFAAWRLWRCSRRYDAVGADEAMALDPRPPVLYLRSFRDDDDALIDDGGSAVFRHLMQALAPPSPEQEMADILARLGPVVAIGKPGEPLPQLGAARLYVSHELWQDKVRELMRAASLVVVRVGASPGVLWEIEQALATLPRQRLVLAILGGSAVAPELVARLGPVLGPSFEAALPQPLAGGWKKWAFRDPRRRIGGLIGFRADGSALAQPVRAWPVALRDLIFLALMRPSAAPLRHAWRELLRQLGHPQAVARSRRSRLAAVLLALLFGWAGAQWFYLGRNRRGWVYLLTLPVFMAPLFVSFFDALRFIWVERAEFDSRFVADGARGRA